MHLSFRKKTLLALAGLAVSVTISGGIALAHDHREVEGYRLTVGFRDEPALEGLANGVDLRVEKAAESDTAGGHGHGEMAPVEGLEGTLQVEVTHVASGVSRMLALRAVFGEAGRYTADLIPTSSGVYRFRFVGSIEGTAIDETFESGEGRFSNIEPAAGLHFPETRATLREVEGAARGAQSLAEQAQDAARAAARGASTARMLGIVGIAAGVLGAAVGGAGVAMAMRRR